MYFITADRTSPSKILAIFKFILVLPAVTLFILIRPPTIRGAPTSIKKALSLISKRLELLSLFVFVILIYKLIMVLYQIIEVMQDPTTLTSSFSLIIFY